MRISLGWTRLHFLLQIWLSLLLSNPKKVKFLGYSNFVQYHSVSWAVSSMDCGQSINLKRKAEFKRSQYVIWKEEASKRKQAHRCDTQLPRRGGNWRKKLTEAGVKCIMCINIIPVTTQNLKIRQRGNPELWPILSFFTYFMVGWVGVPT